eukprot:gene7809-9275_t
MFPQPNSKANANNDTNSINVSPGSSDSPKRWDSCRSSALLSGEDEMGSPSGRVPVLEQTATSSAAAFSMHAEAKRLFQFTLYDAPAGDAHDHKQPRADEENEMLSIIWESTVLRLAPGSKRLTVNMPVRNGGLNQWMAPKKENETYIFKNREPEWSTVDRSYVMDFGDRVTLPSVKNFALIGPVGGGDVMVCGRVAKDIFVCDFTTPLKPVHAFAIAVSAFDFKLCNAW